MHTLIRGLATATLLGSMFVTVGERACAQQSQLPNQLPIPGQPQQPNHGLPPIDGRDPGDPVITTEQTSNRARVAAIERQKKIVEETAKLLQLATELKNAVDQTTKDELSLEVVKKADEIERLAHDVKIRMKG